MKKRADAVVVLKHHPMSYIKHTTLFIKISVRILRIGS